MSYSSEINSESSGRDATRQRLIDAALQLFSRGGFEAVSTRALARAAQVNQAAIPYHFDSKEGLYHAVAHRIVELVWPSVEPTVQTIRAHHPDGVRDQGLARSDVAELVIALLQRTFNDPNHYEIGFFMLREQMQPTAAWNILYDGLIQPLHEILGYLVAALRGKPKADPDVIIEVQALFGETVVFSVYRTTLAHRLGTVGLREAQLNRIMHVVRDMVFRQFPLDDNNDK
jgi:AcrR family transcriptional regulator